jgi:hypothetical protein
VYGCRIFLPYSGAAALKFGVADSEEKGQGRIL